ncbi:hypothetical protein J6590_084799 [Homalodisca vitripennis]|nr:hypothetical protein J6590_084799 [Homalodisca vitripennis]
MVGCTAQLFTYLITFINLPDTAVFGNTDQPNLIAPRLDTSKSVEKRIKWPKPEEKKEEEKARGLANKSKTCVRGGGGNEGLRSQHVSLSLSLSLSLSINFCMQHVKSVT